MRIPAQLWVPWLVALSGAVVGCSDGSKSGDGDTTGDGDATGDGDMTGDGDGDGDAMGDGDGAGEYFFEATIVGSPSDHATLNVNTVPEAFAEFRDTPNGERISIHVNADPGVSDMFQTGSQSLRMYLMPYEGLQTYVLNSEGNIGAAYAEDDSTHVFFAQYGMPDHGSGNIVITARTDNDITGTFSFVAEDQTQLSSVEVEGAFYLPLLPDGT